MKRLRITWAAVAAVLAGTCAAVHAAPGGGGELLFKSNRSKNVFEYYRMAPDTRRVERVLAERGEATQMSWSPDGTRVLFTAARGGPFPNVFVTHLVDGRTVQLTREAAPVSEPVWSPDGTRVAFVSSRDGPRRVYVMNADGSDVRPASTWAVLDEISPRFSPDGRRLAMLAILDATQQPRVSVVDLRTGAASVVSKTRARGTETAPVWSPDGTRLLTSVTRSQQAHIVSIASDGGTSTDLTRGDARHVDPQWSPDGTQILYLAIPGDSARQSLHVMNADGSGARKLHGAGLDVMGARWSLDGRRIFFVEHRDEGGKIFAIDATGQGLQRLSGDEGFDIDIETPCCQARPARVADLK